MQYNNDKGKVLQFGTSNEQPIYKTGNDWLNTVLHKTFQVYERPSVYMKEGEKHQSHQSLSTLLKYIDPLYILLKTTTKEIFLFSSLIIRSQLEFSASFASPTLIKKRKKKKKRRCVGEISWRKTPEL